MKDGAMLELVTAYEAVIHVRDQIARCETMRVQPSEVQKQATSVDQLSDILCDLVSVAGTIKATTFTDLRAKSDLLLSQFDGGCYEGIEQLAKSICLDIRDMSKHMSDGMGVKRSKGEPPELSPEA
jgi:hypothetical protein